MNILINIIRFVGGICFVYFISRDVKDFFSYQLVVSVIELSVFFIRFYLILPKDNSNISDPRKNHIIDMISKLTDKKHIEF